MFLFLVLKARHRKMKIEIVFDSWQFACAPKGMSMAAPFLYFPLVRAVLPRILNRSRMTMRRKGRRKRLEREYFALCHTVNFAFLGNKEFENNLLMPVLALILTLVKRRVTDKRWVVMRHLIRPTLRIKCTSAHLATFTCIM